MLTIGEGLSVAGIATFSSQVYIDASLDVLNRAKINNFKSVGVTTLASSGGITTTGGDLLCRW